MSLVPENLKYTKDHEWANVDGALATIGVTDHAQRELGDIVFVELPKIGARFEAGQSFGTIEAVKTVAELYSPVTGTIKEVNTALSADAGAINSDPYGTGWIIKMEMDNAAEASLISSEEYKTII